MRSCLGLCTIVSLAAATSANSIASNVVSATAPTIQEGAGEENVSEQEEHHKQESPPKEEKSGTIDKRNHDSSSKENELVSDSLSKRPSFLLRGGNKKYENNYNEVGGGGEGRHHSRNNKNLIGDAKYHQSSANELFYDTEQQQRQQRRRQQQQEEGWETVTTAMLDDGEKEEGGGGGEGGEDSIEERNPSLIPAGRPGSYVPGRFIITLSPPPPSTATPAIPETPTTTSSDKNVDDDNSNKREEIQGRAMTLLRKYNNNAIPHHIYDRTITGFSVSGLTQQNVIDLLNEPDVLYVEQDRIVGASGPSSGGDDGGRPGGGGPPDGGGGGRPDGVGGGGGGRPPVDEDGNCQNQTVPWGVTRVGGGITYTGTSKVWILDTGISPQQDLNIDTTHAINFSTGKDTNWDDNNGHGTLVAGIVAAIDNDCDVVGVAAGAPVVPVRVLNRNAEGFASDMIAGVNHVATYGADGDVANISIGGGGVSLSMDNAVLAAAALGIRFTIAAGNQGTSADLESPGRANGDNIYTISGMTPSDSFLPYSNYGNPPVDYAAPGELIKSLAIGGGTYVDSGTSFAAPHVAGLLLLGPIQTCGEVTNDPDGIPDQIACH